mmetsp:Transcript_37592/g.45360  ORF Transcript_37592/g.45360 Transcript_37592/m.45360 type:complete len:229 (-) Transcript_37592:12-698(-)
MDNSHGTNFDEELKHKYPCEDLVKHSDYSGHLLWSPIMLRSNCHKVQTNDDDNSILKPFLLHQDEAQSSDHIRRRILLPFIILSHSLDPNRMLPFQLRLRHKHHSILLRLHPRIRVDDHPDKDVQPHKPCHQHKRNKERDRDLPVVVQPWLKPHTSRIHRMMKYIRPSIHGRHNKQRNHRNRCVVKVVWRIGPHPFLLFTSLLVPKDTHARLLVIYLQIIAFVEHPFE